MINKVRYNYFIEQFVYFDKLTLKYIPEIRLNLGTNKVIDRSVIIVRLLEIKQNIL
jgi:hypothetical protein